MKGFRKFAAIILSTFLIFSLVGCGQNTVKKDNGTKKETKKEDTNKNKTLKIIATSEDYKPLFDKFTKETGTKIEFLSMSSGEVISRTKAEGGKPMADVWFGGGVDAFMQAKEDGLLEKYKFKDSDKIVAPYKDEEGYWYSKGLTVVGFIVNKDVLKEKNLPEPKTWDDLAKPIYKDEVLMSNPAISGTNYAVVNSLLQNKGEEKGWKYFEDLNKNIPFYSKRGKDPNQKTIAGEVGIGITYIDKNLESMQEEKNVKIIYPEDGIPWMPDGVAIFKNASNMDAAKKFVSWMYKDENLKEIAKEDDKDSVKIIKPDLKGIKLTLPQDKLLKQDLSLFGKNREAILEKWSKMVGDK